MVDGIVFIGLVIVGITDLYRYLRDRNYEGAFTIVVAVLAGLLVGLVDTMIGIPDLTVAQGVMAGLSAVGVVAIAKKV